ncbi:type II toxin-antitoxin system PemK/MazF family toxin [Novispirillum itersonii]|uniref:type II toxin-antitoxin system PemK/MazF family toxin n=1 Tax=Novispirillum itersonii TaxID=189 RepID=UPI00047809C5
MPITYHPKIGTLVLCDFTTGFLPPEMVKRRPAVVISPPIGLRKELCTVVPISTTVPVPAVPWQVEITLDPPLPSPWDAGPHWVKADMVFAASFSRLDLFRLPRRDGKRQYLEQRVTDGDLRRIRGCLLASLGLVSLTENLPGTI